MITQQLLAPKSIAIIGGSNDITKPGGRVIKNLLSGRCPDTLYVVNPKEKEIQGIKCYNSVEDLPNVDLAILCIAAKFCKATVETLCSKKNTKAIIIVSAGFSETGPEGKALEQQIVDICNQHNAAFIGPNCIGMLTPVYSGVFIGPIPKLDNTGCDFVSGSGATAVYILKEANTLGLNFASVYSVGNSAQIGVEDVIEYWDNTFDAKTSPRVKLLYLENIKSPERLLKHCRSLIKKGCKIAAIKAGTTDAGARAASSHTGALAGSDTAVSALFKKAGIIRCYSRIELVTVATVLQHPEAKGKNIAIVTHAGGPGVMTTDTLSEHNMNVPKISGKDADELLSKLFFGSSVANPIDFLATGTAQQLGDILDAIENKFDNIDAAVVIYGSPYLFDVTEVYKTVYEKKKICKKPIFFITPSSYHTEPETQMLFDHGCLVFDDEVAFAKALGKVCNHKIYNSDVSLPEVDVKKIREVIDNSSDGYISPEKVQMLFDAAGIPRAKEIIVSDKKDIEKALSTIYFPIVMKVVGPVHKSDVGGVKLNIKDLHTALETFDKMMTIPDSTGVLIQPMLSGIELFVGAKRDNSYGHIILCGLGGIFIEVLKDVQSALAPVGKDEALDMLKSLKGYKILQGTRGQEGVNQDILVDIILRLSALLKYAPEIFEMDINPLLGTSKSIIAVDGRIRIEHK